MAFDAFNPIYFAPSVMPVASPPSPSAAYDASMHSAQVTAASLQVPQTPVFVPPPAPVNIMPASSGFGALSALALFAQTHGSMTLPQTVIVSPPTTTIDQSGGLVMPPPMPSNPVTFPPSPPQGPQIPPGGVPSADALFFGSLLGL